MVLTTMYSGGSSGSNKSSKPEEDQLYHYPQQQQQRLRRDDHNHASSSLSPQRPRQRELHRRRLDLASLVFVVPWLLLLLLGVEPNRTPATPSTILPVVLVHAFSTTTTAIPAPLFRRNCNYKYNNNKKSYTTASSRRPLSTPTQLHHQQPKQPQHLTAALKRVHRHFQFYQSTGTSTALFHHPPSSSSSSSSTTRLAAATPLENDDSTSNNPPNNIFQTALAKFRARPVALLMIPVIAAFVGWLTNWLAVQMIFYPIRYRSLIPNNIWNTQWNPELPLGLLGWQGIIPCKTRPMTIALTDMVTSQLVTVPEALARLDPAAVATLLSPRVPDLTRDVLPQLLRVPGGALSSLLDHPFLIHRVYRDFCEQLTRAMQEQATTIFSLQNCVVSQMVQNRAKLGELFQLCGQAELDFLTNSGLWFGFLLGIVQMIVALFWDNPWSLSMYVHS